MAEKGIRRIVQLILDKATAEQVRRETAEALEKGTDAQKAKRNLGAVEAGMERLKGAALKLGGVLAGVFAVRKIIAFGKEAVRAAMEAEAVWNRLGQAVQNAGASFEEMEPRIRAAARAMMDATTVGDDDFAVVLTELVTITNDLEGSLGAVQVVADLAAAKQIDLSTAAQLVGRAMVGQTSTLTRYGIVIEEGSDAVEVMRQRFAGFAENEAKTFQGRLTQLSGEWGEFKEAVGAAMIAAGGGTSILETLIGIVKGLTSWIERNSEGFSGLAVALDVVVKVLGFAWDGLSRLANLITGVVVGATAGLVNGVAALAEAYAWATEAAAKFLDFLGADNKAQGLRNHSDAVKRNAQALREWAATAKQVERELYDAGLSTNRTPPPSSTAAPRSRAAPAGGGGGGGGGPAAPGATGLPAAGPGELGAMQRWDLPTPMLDPVPVQTSLEAIAASAGDMEVEVSAAVQRMTEAFTSGFAAIFDGSKDLGDAAKGVGLQLVAGLTEGMAEYHFAQAAGKLAEGLWPPNPVAIASALKHALAGAAFAALQGFARAGASGGGRSGGGMSRGGSAAALARVPRAEKPGNEIHVHFEGPGFDAVNPTVQRVVAGAMQQVQERYGPNTKIQVHRKR